MSPNGSAFTVLLKLYRFVESAWKLIRSLNSSWQSREIKYTGNEICDDVAFIILSKLPLKSLKRFTCIQKPWTDLLENPHFRSAFCTNFLSKQPDDTYVLWDTWHRLHYGHHGVRHTLHLHSGDKFENRVELDWPPPLQDEDIRFWCVFGSCIRGTLIFHYNGIKFMLWNPATKQLRIIPRSPLQYPFDDYNITNDSLRFGYDPIKDDFKVIQRLHVHLYTLPYTHPCPISRWEIYSVRSNSWRKLDTHMHVCPAKCDDIYIHGWCHWLGIADIYSAEKCLVSFDFRGEFLFKTSLPPNLDGRPGSSNVPKCLIALNGSVALISEYPETMTFLISIMIGDVDSFDTEVSWTKFCIIGPLPEVEVPIGGGTNGNIFFKQRKANGDGLVLFDLRTQTLKKVDDKLENCTMLYKKSNLPIESPIGQIDYY